VGEVKLDSNLYFNNNTGKYEEGVRDPVTHVVNFKSSGEAPEATEAALAKAQELSVSITSVEGSGKDGRITVSDVEKAAGGGQTPASEPSSNQETDEERARREAEERAAAQVQQ
jgi:pyruvate/2-oxoglutarate dehydrogenase complex dihydrolipoamide acyltransferase (E2) component